MLDNIRIPSTLLQAVQKREVVLFAGAGISRTILNLAGWDIQKAIGTEIQKDYPDYDYNVRTYEEVCDDYVVLNDRNSLVFKLASMFSPSTTSAPAHLAAVKTFRYIVTTNYDTLFEAAMRQSNEHYQVLSREADAPGFSFDQHNLIKLHGSADQPLTLISTLDDYEGYNDTHPQLLDLLTNLLYSNTILFVGYSLRDEHIRHLLSHVRRQRGPWQRKAYAVMGGQKLDEVRIKALAARNIEVLAYDADNFLPELATRAGF
jgi:SIR2-like domain